MTVSRLDQLYRRLLLTKFFTRGWGKPDNLKRLFAFRKILSNRETCQHLVAADYPINIDKEYRDGDCVILEGHFTSPFIHHLPGIMPKEVETASFQMILPLRWRHSTLKPVCIHLAGTGDHYFWRRRILTARPLLKEAGIASILLENPYYGTRKPKQQLRSSLHNVSDLFVMGGALVLESLVLLHWCEREGWGPLGLSGISMGGHVFMMSIFLEIPGFIAGATEFMRCSQQMASGAATLWPKPISLVPILSWTTASIIFTQGVMSGAIPWKTLQEQFFENSIYQDEIRKLIISPEDKRKAYVMGQQFVKDYSQDILKMESIHQKLADKPEVMTSFGTAVSPVADTRQDSRAGKSVDQLSSSNCGKNLVGSHHGHCCDGQDVAGVKQLSCQEYIARVSHELPLSEGTDLRILSSCNESGERILSAASSASFGSLQQYPSVTLTTSLSLQKQQCHPLAKSTPPSADLSAPSPSADLSALPTDTSLNQQQGALSTDAPYHHISHARIKQSISHSLTNNLTLKDVISKSRLVVPHLPDSEDHMKDLQHDALDFMRGVMDECTHLGNFSIPVDPELVIIVSAKQDAYVPKEGVIGLDQLWPGCEVRYVDNGHVGAVLFNQSVFRKAVVDAFDRQIKKYYQSPVSPDVKHSVGSIS